MKLRVSGSVKRDQSKFTLTPFDSFTYHNYSFSLFEVLSMFENKSVPAFGFHINKLDGVTVNLL